MKLKKIRNALLVMLTLALVSATAVTLTLAYVPSNVGTKVNEFKNPELKVLVGEDKWDSLGYDGKTSGGSTTIPDSGSDVTLPITGGSLSPALLGYNVAQKYSQGQTINKNPSVKNDSAAPTAAFLSDITNKAWLGMSVDYRVKVYEFDEDYADAADKTGLTDDSTWLLYTLSTKNATKATAVPTVTSGKFVYGDGTAVAAGETTLTGDLWYSFPSRTAFESYIATLKFEDGNDANTDPDDATYASVAATNTANTWVVPASGNVGKEFYYTSPVDPQADTTTKLFNYVTVNTFTTVTDVQIGGTGDKYTAYQIFSDGINGYLLDMPEFDIVLRGYGVQYDDLAWGIGTDKAPAALHDLIAANE